MIPLLLSAFLAMAEPVHLSPPFQTCNCEPGDEWDGICCPPPEPKDEIRDDTL